MMKIVFVFCLLAVSTGVLAQLRPIPNGGRGRTIPHDPSGRGTWNGKVSFTKLRTVTGFSHPESVLVGKSSIFISDMGEDTDSLVKDGEIVKYSFEGGVDTSFKLKEPLISPMGMSEFNNSLYIADQNRVVVISSVTGDFEWELDLSHMGATFLNDVKLIDHRYLLVSATNLKRIYCIDTFTKSLIDFNIDLQNNAPNGIEFDSENSILYIAANKEHKLGEYGNGVVLSYSLDMKNKEALMLSKKYIGKFIDGISIDGESILISDWFSRKADGRIYTLNKTTLEYIKETIFQTSGLADFDYDETKKLLVNPDFVNGKIYFYRKNY